MNLRELLLQFNGESSEMLKMEDVVLDNISGLDICEENSGSIKMLVENPDNAEKIMSDVDKALKENGHDSYDISIIEEGDIKFLLVEK